ncbi:MAG: site-specific DNA-methyltransferase [Pseudomonadota bacterium]
MSEGKREKVAKTSPDIVAERIEALREMFPEAVSEGKVDFDRLRAALGDKVDDRPERYSFSWAGKRDAIRLLQVPSRATLVPAPEESVNFSATGHVFIEGENLEVLKLLYKAYAGRVKMIYIDPPYNTGNDFIYPDNFADPLDTYLKLTGQKDSNGNLLTSNPEKNGRFHSAWLSMMYPRLFLTRQLLREDGVIFISIDDNEVHNLRIAMNEVFGEENFVAQLIWKSRQSEDTRAKTGVSTDHEYIVCYRKSDAGTLRGTEKDLEKFSNPDNDPRGPWRSADLTGLATRDRRPNLHYDLVDPNAKRIYECPPKGWRFDPSTMKKKIEEKRILFPSNGTGRPRHKLFLNEMKSNYKNFSSVLLEPTTADGTREINCLLENGIFGFPKPSALLKLLVQQAPSDNDLVLDFFAGSCTTAQAVLELNREDGGNRRFIMVQLPEPTDREDFSTIAEIGKERIRRVIANMKVEDEDKLALQTRDVPEDLGFAVFKLAESNYRQWAGVEGNDPERYAEEMALFVDPLLLGWRPENVIWEVALKEGYSLTARIEPVAGIKGNVVHLVTDSDKDQSFRICLDSELKPETIQALGLTKDDFFICRDVALTDELAANLALQCRLKTI